MSSDRRVSLLRVVVPLVALGVGLGVAWAVYRNTARHPHAGAPAPVSPAAPTGQQAGSAPAGPGGSPGRLPATSLPAQASPVRPGTRAEVPPAPVPASLTGLRARAVTGDPVAGNFLAIGDDDPSAPYALRVEFSTLGAGIRRVTLSRHFTTIRRDAHVLAQEEMSYQRPDGNLEVVTPFAAVALLVDSAPPVSLLGAYEDTQGGLRGVPVWRQVSAQPDAAEFEAVIEDAAGQVVARVVRRYQVAAHSYVIRVHQHVENLAPVPLRVRWQQFGPVELPRDDVAYGGDQRRVRFGYLLDPRTQGRDPAVSASDFLWGHAKALGPQEAHGLHPTVHVLWPNDVSIRNGYRLVWLGFTNRYFGSAMVPLLPPHAGPDDKVFTLAETVERVLLQRHVTTGAAVQYDPVMIFRTTSAAVDIPPGGRGDFSCGLYSGPLSRPQMRRDPSAAAAGLPGLVVYNFGGPCAWCTFAFLTGGLVALLRFLHHYLLFDWALAIIVLVFLVRLVLHPVTRWSQVRMQRFARQMQALAPKQKKLQERYAADPKRLREEMARLWREEGVSPAGALGCLPMFLQTPVWIALFATLYFAVDLRHQPAFFGVFQAIQPASWPTWWFLGDLSEPDRFLYFGTRLFTIPLLGYPIDSLNLLPVLLAFVFYAQQKYLTPPTPPGTLTPEQEQQQKIAKWMMVILFPVLMYPAPSGLSLYFIANSVLGIIETRHIRAHIERYDKGGAPPAPRREGFLARLQRLAEERQKQLARARATRPRRN